MPDSELLVPAPSAYGWNTPELGPWFDTAGPELPLPLPDLSIALPGPLTFCAPASGTLQLYSLARDPSHELARLRKPDGSPLFEPASSGWVALFRLLPEVEERLHRLTAWLPTLSDNPVHELARGELPLDAPRQRARVRWFALTLDAPLPEATQLAARIGLEHDPSDDTIDARSLGLAGSPIALLRRPSSLASECTVCRIDSGETARLHVFDARGRPIDPGAVAAWWRALSTHFSNLVQGDAALPRVQTGRNVYLVTAHDVALDDALRERVQLRDRLDAASSVPAYSLRLAETESAQGTPLRAALMPNGSYRALTLEAGLDIGFSSALERDFAQVSVIDLESHLVGVARSNADTASADERKQHDESTRVSVHATTTASELVVRTTIDDGVRAALELYENAEAVRLVAGAIDPDWGALAPPTLGEIEPPRSLRVVEPGAEGPDTVSVRGCSGSGSRDGARIHAQRVFVRVEVANATETSRVWVRVWMQGFDLRLGRRVRLHGGAGLTDAHGVAQVVAQLPDGAQHGEAALGLDVAIYAAHKQRSFSDLRFRRPTFIELPALDLATATEPFVCEAGQPLSAADPVPKAAHVVALSGEGAPRQVDLARAPAARWVEDAWVRRLRSSDHVELTQPARLDNQRGIQHSSELPVELAHFHRFNRGAADTRPTEPLDGVDLLAPAGSPPRGVERLEVACTQIGTSSARAVLLTAPALRRYHELLPHRSGHIGAPAAAEYHGTAVILDHNAAVALDQYAFERMQRWTVDLLRVAGERTLPSLAAADDGCRRIALLRTVQSGVELELPALHGLPDIPVSFLAGPLSEALALLPEQVSELLREALLRTTVAPAVAALRRRLCYGLGGAQEGYASLRAAFARAEDLVYIETPDLGFAASAGTDAREKALWSTLASRLSQRPGLCVVLCVATDIEADSTVDTETGQPTIESPAARRARREGIERVIDLLGHSERVVVFTPGAGAGRSVYFASTTVIVDDAYALTGTTHLSATGLGVDASLACALTDDDLRDGRPHCARWLRSKLIGERLGLMSEAIPDDAYDLVTAVRDLVAAGGAGRLSQEPILEPVADPP